MRGKSNVLIRIKDFKHRVTSFQDNTAGSSVGIVIFQKPFIAPDIIWKLRELKIHAKLHHGFSLSNQKGYTSYVESHLKVVRLGRRLGSSLLKTSPAKPGPLSEPSKYV